MDAAAFVETLPSLWEDFPRSELPRDLRFAEILESVPGLTRPNNLALLHLAATQLPPTESYVEVGSLRGTSLIAAMFDNSGKDFVAIDDFSMKDASRSELERNLRRYGLTEVTILEGDAFAILRDGAFASGRSVGVYYYDAAHSYQHQLDGLRLIEPYLAREALLIVDDTDWDFVAEAVEDYIASQPRVTPLVAIGGKDTGAPAWWEGVRALRWLDEPSPAADR
jgi:predicted O-methyltransferase YrrM